MSKKTNDYLNQLIADATSAAENLRPNQEVTASDLIGAHRYNQLSDLDRDKIEHYIEWSVDYGQIDCLVCTSVDSKRHCVYTRIPNPS